MRGSAGDRLVVPDPGGGAPRTGTVLAAHGHDGAPPFLVEWSEDGRRSFFFPGPTAYLETTGGPPPL
jgi:hypothetical protein